MRRLVLQGTFAVSFLVGQAGSAQVSDDGLVETGNVRIPYSTLASEESRRDFVLTAKFLREVNAKIAAEKGMPGETEIQRYRRALDKYRMIPQLEKLKRLFPVQIKADRVGGVTVDIVSPSSGVSPHNQDRILINLHGGGFVTGARYSGQQESVPIAAIGGFRVISVDYREGPENRFPAASEDVATVYRELLKTYRPENIGIYGCSAGGSLTAQSVSWFQTHGLPAPGAVGIFGAGGMGSLDGDSNYYAAIVTGTKPNPTDMKSWIAYFSDPALNLDDPLISPALHPDTLAKFPPTLIIAGTRDMGMSAAVATHAKLVDAGVPTELHVIEAARHCSFAQPKADPGTPEDYHAWRVITRFFDGRLGHAPR